MKFINKDLIIGMWGIITYGFCSLLAYNAPEQGASVIAIMLICYLIAYIGNTTLIFGTENPVKKAIAIALLIACRVIVLINIVPNKGVMFMLLICLFFYAVAFLTCAIIYKDLQNFPSE